MDAAAAVDALGSCPIGQLPANEAQARPLTGLAPDEQCEAWTEAVATAPKGRVTGKHVERVVAKRKPKPKAHAFIFTSECAAKARPVCDKEAVFLSISAKVASDLAKYVGPVTKEVVNSARCTASAWTKLAEKLQAAPAPEKSRGSFDDAMLMMEAFKRVGESLDQVRGLKPTKSMAVEVADAARRSVARLEQIIADIEKAY
jgi:hypothetical protein